MNRRKFMTTSLGALACLSLGGAYYWPRRWRYIVIHHSAGRYGNIEFLQQVHRERQAHDPIDAIPYHYIIGNGNGLADGDIDSDKRQQWHLWGAHVSHRNRDRNARGIGICLIGNLEQTPMTAKQYQTLLSLVKRLMAQYDIPLSNVSGHGHTEGERTLCPGQHFPMAQFLSDIA